MIIRRALSYRDITPRHLVSHAIDRRAGIENGKQSGGHVAVGDDSDQAAAADDKAKFTFRGEPKPVTVPDAPPVDMAKQSDE